MRSFQLDLKSLRMACAVRVSEDELSVSLPASLRKIRYLISLIRERAQENNSHSRMWSAISVDGFVTLYTRRCTFFSVELIQYRFSSPHVISAPAPSMATSGLVKSHRHRSRIQRSPCTRVQEYVRCDHCHIDIIHGKRDQFMKNKKDDSCCFCIECGLRTRLFAFIQW